MLTFEKKVDMFQGLAVVRIEYDLDKQQLEELKHVDCVVLHHTSGVNEIGALLALHRGKYGWGGIGYHFVIGKDGTLYLTRPLEWSGSHVSGFNEASIGVALVGNLDVESPTSEQVLQLYLLLEALRKEYGELEVLGHIEAAYRVLKDKVPDLPALELEVLQEKAHVDAFIERLRYFCSEYTPEHEDGVSRLKSCPGVHCYAILKQWRNPSTNVK